MGLKDFLHRRRAATEPQYDEPVVIDEVWVRDESGGHLVRQEVSEDDVKEGQ